MTIVILPENLLENCDSCYQFQLSEYPGSITIKGALDASTNYILKVIDKFGNKFSTTPQASDSAGNITFVVGTRFPPQFFNRNAGLFRFELSKTAVPWTPEDMTFETFVTDCVLVEFVNDNGGINTIQ